MVDKKELHESLGSFINAVTNGDENDIDIFKGYFNGKMEEVLLDERGNIKLEGDDVMIDGKKVGTATTSGEDEAKIKFESDCGEYKKDFDSVEGMYEYLTNTYNMNEGKAEADKAVAKQSAKKTDRLARWSAVRNKKQPDGKAGEYDAKDLRPEHKDPEKGGSEAAHSGGEADLKTDMKYDSHDPRPKHKDPEKG